ncbi:hypothetical protein D3C80_1664980 [compost metagenome]
MQFGQNDLALGRTFGLHAQGRRKDLEQVDGGGVGDHYFTGAGADQTGEFIAETGRQGAPLGGVPAADQALAPFLFDHLRGPGKRCMRACAEGVAVQVDDALGQGEFAAQRSQRVGLVQFEQVLFCCHA